MCILTLHWFDDTARPGSRILETPYAWPDPSALRPGTALTLSDDPLVTEGRRKRRLTADTDVEAGVPIAPSAKGNTSGFGPVIALPFLPLLDSATAVGGGARIQRAGGVVVPVSEDADEDAEEKAVDESDVIVTRW